MVILRVISLTVEKMVRDIFINVVIYAINSVRRQGDNLLYFDVDDKFR